MSAWSDLWRRPVPTERAALSDFALLFGRVAVVIALWPNAIRKIMTFEQTALGMGGVPQVINGRPWPDQQPLFAFPAPELFLGLSTIFDIVGTLSIVLGLYARPAALWMAFYIALAQLIFHTDIRNGQEAILLLRNLAYVGGPLLISAAGPGWWSLDGLRARSRAGSRARFAHQPAE